MLFNAFQYNLSKSPQMTSCELRNLMLSNFRSKEKFTTARTEKEDHPQATGFRGERYANNKQLLPWAF